MANQIRPKILIRADRINEPVRVPILDLLVKPVAKTFLSSDSASSSGTLTVKNIAGFAINQILLIGEPGNEGSEIIKTHASTAPTGSTVTLASNTVFPHSAGTFVYVIGFDQLEISTATTLTGSKSVLGSMPVSIVADSPETIVNDLSSPTGYYFARFKNSITALFSPYSDGVPITGYTLLTARSIIDSALSEINKTTSEVLSDEFFFQQINTCQTEVLREVKRWSFLQSFNQILGNAATGGWKIAVPTDLDDQNTNRTIWNFRVGKETRMIWVDKEKFDELTQGLAFTTLASNIIVGASTATLTDSSDFGDSGTITIGANTYTFTANVVATGVLTLDAVTTTTNTALEDVFLNPSQGNPRYWTIFGGYIYHYPILSSTYNGRNYYMDYYKKQTAITTDSDTIVLPDQTLVQYYLQWKALKKLNNGSENEASVSMRDMYLQRREKLKQKEVLGRTFKLRPRFNNFAIQSQSNMDDNERIRLGNFPDV